MLHSALLTEGLAEDLLDGLTEEIVYDFTLAGEQRMVIDVLKEHIAQKRQSSLFFAPWHFNAIPTTGHDATQWATPPDTGMSKICTRVHALKRT